RQVRDRQAIETVGHSGAERRAHRVIIAEYCPPMRIVRHSFVLVPLLAMASAGLLVGTAGVGIAKPSPVTKITLRVSLTSVQRNVEMVGRGGEITYGFNRLEGTTTTASGTVGVQILGNVEYTKGSGPFFGFLTLKFASLSTLGLRIEGTATFRKDGTTALK